MLCFTMAIGFCMSAVGGMTTATLTALEDEFGYSATQLATILVMYDVGAFVSAFPSAHYGPHCLPRWLGSGVLITVLGLVLYAVSSHIVLFGTAQVLCGFGGGSMWILSVIHIDNNCNNKALVPDFTGWLMAITPLGVIFGFIAAGAFLTKCESSDGSDSAADCADSRTAPSAVPTAPSDCSSWRPPFFVLAGLMFGPAVWYALSRSHYASPRTNRCCGDPPEPEDTASKEDATAPSGVVPHSGLIGGAKVILFNPRVLLVALGTGVHTFQSTAIIAFGPRFMERQLCVSKSTASLLTGTFIPVICAGLFAGGRIPASCNWGLGKVRHQIAFMVVTTLGSLPIAVVSFFAESLALFLVCVMFSLALMFAMTTPSVTSIERQVDEEDRAAAVAAQNIAVRAIGAIPGPIALGALLDAADSSTEERSAYVVILSAGIIAASILWAVAWFLQRPHDRREERAQVGQQVQKGESPSSPESSPTPPPQAVSGAASTPGQAPQETPAHPQSLPMMVKASGTKDQRCPAEAIELGIPPTKAAT